MVKKQHVKANVSKFHTLLPGLESVGKEIGRAHV
jgi:hypothetical protein